MLALTALTALTALYVLADVTTLGPIDVAGAVEEMAQQGIRSIQLRAKPAPSKPLVAIGGIGVDNLGEVLATGVDSVAVLGAICAAEDIAAVGRNCRRLLAAVEEAG